MAKAAGTRIVSLLMGASPAFLVAAAFFHKPTPTIGDAEMTVSFLLLQFSSCTPL
jgi:hypothetical protein